jgi:hypothetical protein
MRFILFTGKYFAASPAYDPIITTTIMKTPLLLYDHYHTIMIII